MVEPNVRHGGSLELFASPGLFVGPRASPLVRAGGRAYLPVLHRGEYLSVSFGAAAQYAFHRTSPAFEVGVYALYGILGLRLWVAPGADPLASRTLAITVRYF